jgi:hypothetical protein
MNPLHGQSGVTLIEGLLGVLVVLVVVGGVLMELGCWGGSKCTKRTATMADGCATGEVCTNPGTVCDDKWFGADCICATVKTAEGACKVACKKP